MASTMAAPATWIASSARSCRKSRRLRSALERKSTGSANWKSSHHQSFQRLSVGTTVAIEPLWKTRTARPDMDEKCHW